MSDLFVKAKQACVGQTTAEIENVSELDIWFVICYGQVTGLLIWEPKGLQKENQ